MTGLRKRVTVGFLSIVCLLFFSGMVSFLELSHLSRDTGEILKANKRNIELAKEMLDAAHEQNIALIRLSVFGDRSCDSLCRKSMERLENTLLVAQSEALEKSFLDSLAFATTELRLADGQLPRLRGRRPCRLAGGPAARFAGRQVVQRRVPGPLRPSYGRHQELYDLDAEFAGSARRADEEKRLPRRDARADLAGRDDRHRADALLLHVDLLRRRPSSG